MLREAGKRYNAEMSSEREKARRWWRVKFSIRELLGLICIVALVLGYARATALRREATDRLEAALY